MVGTRQDLTPEGQQSLSYFDLVLSVWRRKGLFAMGLIVGLMIGVLYYVQAKPTFESVAEVLVVKKRPEFVTGDRTYAGETEDYLSTHVAVVKSPLIIQQAIANANLGALPTFQEQPGNQAELLEAIQDELSVGHKAGNILSLSFRGPVADDCAAVLQAILDTFQHFLNETYRDMGDETVTLITQARDVLNNDLQAQEAAYHEFRSESPLVASGSDEVNPRQERLASIESQLTELLLRRTQLESHLAQLTTCRQSGGTYAQLFALVSRLTKERDDVGTVGKPAKEAELFAMYTELANYSQSPEHPEAQAIRRRIKAAHNVLALPYEIIHQTLPGSADHEAGMQDPVQLYLSYLGQEIDGLRTSERMLTELYDREHESAKELATYELRDAASRRNIERTQVLYDGIVSQLQGARLVKDYGGFDARVIAPPWSGEKINPQALIVFPAAGMLGMLLGGLFVLAAETSDKRLRTVEDIKREVDYPVLGQVPEYAAAAVGDLGESSVSPMLCVYHKPWSAATDAFRGVRTALHFGTRGRAHKVIQITSPSPGDGKSTLASNLAVCIAQCAKSVLLIDADLRRPRLHQLFAVENNIGLSSVIQLDAELTDAVRQTAIPHLAILPSGPLPPDPSVLLGSPDFQGLLESVRAQYDYVLINTGPLLAVADPLAVAPLADGVVLALRLSKSSRAQVRRASEILHRIDARVLGVVINGAGMESASPSYGAEPMVVNGKAAPRPVAK